MKFFPLATALLLFLNSCTDNPNARLIIGHWQGVSWEQNGADAQLRAGSTSFHFDTTGRYVYRYGEMEETGTYKVENQMLFTKPQDGLEIMVNIAKLNQDTLIFDMSRKGTPEQLVLKRINP